MKYDILDNGGYPYSVDIKEKKVDIYYNNHYEDTEALDAEPSPPFVILELKPKEIFIGKSFKTKITEFSEGYGIKEDGNTCLFGMGKNKYIFINRHVCEFKALAKIIYFTSPIGNSGVPYPYAIDEKGNYYFFMLENRIDITGNEAADYEEPLDYYFSKKCKIIKSIKMDIIHKND